MPRAIGRVRGHVSGGPCGTSFGCRYSCAPAPSRDRSKKRSNPSPTKRGSPPSKRRLSPRKPSRSVFVAAEERHKTQTHHRLPASRELCHWTQLSHTGRGVQRRRRRSGAFPRGSPSALMFGRSGAARLICLQILPGRWSRGASPGRPEAHCNGRFLAMAMGALAGEPRRDGLRTDRVLAPGGRGS